MAEKLHQAVRSGQSKIRMEMHKEEKEKTCLLTNGASYEFHDGCSRELKKAERLDDAKNQDKRMTDWDEPMQPAVSRSKIYRRKTARNKPLKALAAICAITSSSILNISAVRANDLRKWENVEIVAWFINRWLGVNELSKVSSCEHHQAYLRELKLKE